MTFEITTENFKETINSGKPVMIDFWATWCGPCMQMAPVVDDLAKQFEGRAVIAKCNVEDADEIAAELRVSSIPAFLFFKDGEQLRDLRLVGSQRPAKLIENIESML